MGNLERAKNITTMEKLVQGTAVNSTSGTSIDFTGIPSWAKKITVMFNGISTSGTGTSPIQIQLGTLSGVESSTYFSTFFIQQSNTSSLASSTTSGFVIGPGVYYAASTNIQGLATFSVLSGNTWVANGAFGREVGANTFFSIAGSKTLTGTLDRIRITTVNGTDTFDAGQINILVEG